MNGLQHLISRLSFLVAVILLALAVLERLVNVFGFTILATAYAPGRLLEFAGVLLLFVATLLLRQIREGLAKGERA